MKIKNMKMIKASMLFAYLQVRKYHTEHVPGQLERINLFVLGAMLGVGCTHFQVV